MLTLAFGAHQRHIGHDDVAHWRREVRVFKDEAAEAFTPSMRQRIDLADVYRRTLNCLPDEMYGQLPLPLPPPEESIAVLAEWLDALE